MCRLAFASLSLAIGLGLTPSSSSQTGTGSISGRVTFEGNPVPGVVVTLQLSQSGQPRWMSAHRATTDADGRFRLGGVAAGRYIVSPAAPAFVLPREVPFGPPGKSVTLAEGETVEEIDFALARGGVITGRVTEAGGRPLVEERVVLMRLDEGGRKQTHPEFVTTDDRGVYRVYSLPLGRYLVSVGRSREEGGVVMGGPDRRLQQTFHPDAAEESQAKVVEVTSGGEATGIDIAVGGKDETFEVSGRVVDAETGRPAPFIRLGHGAIRPGETWMGAYGFGMTADGRGEFRLSGLAPGRYAVFAAPEGESEYFSEPVGFEIADADVVVPEIKLRRGGSISGVAVVEGSGDPAVMARLSQLQLSVFSRTSELAAPRPGGTRINPDGSFQIRGLRPGKTMITVQGFRAPKGFVLLRVEHDGVEQRDGIEVGPGEKVAGVRLVIGYGTGVIRGEVKISGGGLPANMRLHVMIRHLTAASQGLPGAEVDARGRFVVEGLTAGEYEVSLMPVFLSPGPGGGPRPQRPPEVKQKVSVANGAETQVTLSLDLSPAEK